MNRIRSAPMTRRCFVCGLVTLTTFGAPTVADEEPIPAKRFSRPPPPITSSNQVLNVMGFEPLARDALPPAHFGYIATGSDDDLTVVRNHEAFSQRCEHRRHRQCGCAALAGLAGGRKTSRLSRRCPIQKRCVFAYKHGP